MTISASSAGIILARELGPSRRGDYAAVSVWFGLALTVGELGLTAATTYFVARRPEAAVEYLATARILMTNSGFCVAGLGWLLAPMLGHEDVELVYCYRLMFLTCLPAFAAGAYVFALQATNITRWNAVRLAQPLCYVLIVGLLGLTDQLTLRSAITATAATVTGQGILAYVVGRSSGLGGGRYERSLAGPMTTYGLSQLLSTAPTVLNARLDQLVLSQTVRSSAVGHYAVAVTLTSLIMPFVSAVGSVVLPRLASIAHHGAAERRLVKSSLLWAIAVASAGLLVIAGSAAWTVPFLFGGAYTPAVHLVWALAPGGVALAVGVVASDLLRGRGQPLAVAWAQAVGAVLTIALLALLIPGLAATGAAIASTVAYTATTGLLLIALRRPSPSDRSSP